LPDPAVRLELVTPWDYSEFRASPILEILRDELTDRQAGLDGQLYEHVLGPLERRLRSEPPPGWDAMIRDDVLEMGPGETRTTDVDLALPSATSLLLAVRATNLDIPDQTAVSNVVVVERGEDGTFALLYEDD
jgi:hypothetical protein